MYKYPVVKVVWVDAETESGWKSPDEISKMNGATCVTIGFLVRKPTRKSPVYVVASTIGVDPDSDSDEVTAIIKIPKAWIKSIEEQQNEKQA